MKLLDLNILIYAIDESSPRHQQARRWLEETLSGSETVAFGWSVLVGFVRLSTRAAIFARPLTVDEAFDVIDGWLRQPCVTVVHPTERHPRLLRDMLSGLGAAGNPFPCKGLVFLRFTADLPNRCYSIIRKGLCFMSVSAGGTSSYSERKASQMAESSSRRADRRSSGSEGARESISSRKTSRKRAIR